MVQLAASNLSSESECTEVPYLEFLIVPECKIAIKNQHIMSIRIEKFDSKFIPDSITSLNGDTTSA
jgi:hypothetical protein